MSASNYNTALVDEPAMPLILRGWRSLRLYGFHAKKAIEDNDLKKKIDMISRIDELLTVMSGIVSVKSEDDKLGIALKQIYTALRYTILKANARNDIQALEDFDKALEQLEGDISKKIAVS